MSSLRSALGVNDRQGFWLSLLGKWEDGNFDFVVPRRGMSVCGHGFWISDLEHMCSATGIILLTKLSDLKLLNGVSVDDSTDHTKKSDDTNQASGEESSSGNGDAIITPLKVSIEEKTPPLNYHA